MDPTEILAEHIKSIRSDDLLACPTCGAQMELVLVGKVNPVYVARCSSVTIPHPTWICTPTMFIPTK